MDMKMLIGTIVMVVGLLVFAASASADYTGLNLTQDDPDHPEFGWVQGFFCTVGALVLFAGLALFFVSGRIRTEAAPDRYGAPKREEAPGPAGTDEDTARRDATASQPATEGGHPDASGHQAESEQNAGSGQQQDAGSAAAASGSADEDKADLEALYANLPPAKEGGTGFECPDCGEPLGQGARSCPACGAIFDSSQTATGAAVA